MKDEEDEEVKEERGRRRSRKWCAVVQREVPVVVVSLR